MLIDYTLDRDLFDWSVELFGLEMVHQTLAVVETRGVEESFDFFVKKDMFKNARIIHILFL